MTTEPQSTEASPTQATPNATPTQTNGLPMRLDYAQASQVVSDMPNATDEQASQNLTQADQATHSDHVALFAQLNRPEVAFHAKVKQPLLFRDCLLALFDIVNSDFRYVPKDRSVYSAFVQMRKASANKNLFAAQQAYFDWLYNNDPLGFCILDPIVQVHEQGVSFEVFSKDEGSYAVLTFTHALFDNANNASAIKFGTTYIDYSPALLQGIEQIRSYRDTFLDIGQTAVGLHTQKPDVVTDHDANVIEKRINVSASWVRSLLQVQSASQLSQDRFSLDPIALYNLLFELRMHADIKGKKRGLLIELVPNQPAVMTLEPFGIVVKSQSTLYAGTTAKLLRLWGRRRLALLKKVLPYCQNVEVTLLGQGMPSYWTLSGEGFHLTFAMTGFSQANWSQSLNFDLLLPKRPTDITADPMLLEQLHTAQDVASLAKHLKLKPTELRAQLLNLAQQGLVRFDMATQTYRYRPLSDTPLDMATLAYHNLAEKQAYELVARPKAITHFTVSLLPTLNTGSGVALSADIEVAEDRRSYHSQLQLNEEGMVSRAECSCPQFLQHRLTQGACSHLIALRLKYAEVDLSKDKAFQGQQTRLFSKRQDNPTAQGVAVTEQIQLTLNQKKLVIEYLANDTLPNATANTKSNYQHKPLRQQWLYNQPSQAHDAFMAQIDKLQHAGYLENQVI